MNDIYNLLLSAGRFPGSKSGPSAGESADSLSRAADAPNLSLRSVIQRVRPYANRWTVASIGSLTAGGIFGKLAICGAIGTVAGPVGTAIGLIVGFTALAILFAVQARASAKASARAKADLAPDVRTDLDAADKGGRAASFLQDRFQFLEGCSNSSLIAREVRSCMDKVFGPTSKFSKREKSQALNYLEWYDGFSGKQTYLEKQICDCCNEYLDKNAPGTESDTELPIPLEPTPAMPANLSTVDMEPSPGDLLAQSIDEFEKPSLPDQLKNILIQATICSSGAAQVKSKKMGVATLLNRVFGPDSEYSVTHKTLAKSCLDSFVQSDPKGSKEIQNYFSEYRVVTP